MTYPTITDLPPAPQRTQTPDAFATTADTFVAALPDLVTEVNTAGAYIDTKTISVGNAFQGAYSAGTTYTTGQSVLYSDLFYLSLVDSNTGNTPDSSPSQWVEIVGAATTSSSGTYDFVASGTISNGDVVAINSDGTVSVASATFAGGRVKYETNNTIYNAAVYDSNSNKVVVVYSESGIGRAYVGTVSGSSITFGARASLGSNAQEKCIAFDSNSNKVVIAYADGTNILKAIVGTVSGTSITFGTEVYINTPTSTGHPLGATFDSNSNKVVIAYRDFDNSVYGTAVVGTVSGTSISFGTPVVFASHSTDKTKATFDSSNNKVVIAYRNASTGYGTAIVGTVSGTSISFGTATVVVAGNTNVIDVVFDSNANKVVVAYYNSSVGKAYASVGTVSGTSISFGTAVIFNEVNTSEISLSFDSSNNKVVIFYDDTSARAVQGEVSGTTINIDTPLEIYAANTNQLASAYDVNANRTVVFYRDATDGDDGTANVLAFGNGDKAIGIATAAISNTATGTITILGGVNESQTGLTAGNLYYLDTATEGGLSTSDASTLIGRAIASDKILVTAGG